MKASKRISRILSRLLFPQACALCGQWVGNDDLSPLCGPCLESFHPFDRRVCHFCGIPTPGNLLETFAVCSRCSSRPPPYDCARAWGAYEGPLRKAIRRFKYDGFPRLAGPLADLMAEGLRQARLDFDFDWIVPVPAHPKRRRERGYDHAALLARRLSRRLQIPVHKGVRRIRHTAPQFGLERGRRRRNLKNAFAVVRPRRLQGAVVLLIDDVMTSGATVEEVSRTLRKQAGVAAIVALAVARPRLTRW